MASLVSIPFAGVDTDGRDGQLKGRADYMNNMRLNYHGGIDTVNGSTVFRSNILSTANCLGMYQFSPSNGDVYYIYYFKNNQGDLTQGSIYQEKVFPTGSSPTLLSSVTGLNNSDPFNFPQFATLNDVLYIADGVNNVFWWDLTTTGSVAIVSSAILTFKNRLFILDRKSTLYWSMIQDGKTLEPNGFVVLGKNDSSNNKNMFVYQDRIYIQKDFTCWGVSGNDFDPVNLAYTVSQLPNIPGTINNRCTTLANGYVYWLTRTNFIQFDGSNFQMLDVGRINITPFKNKTINWSFVYHLERRNEIYIYTSGDVMTGRIIIYNYKTGEFHYYTPGSNATQPSYCDIFGIFKVNYYFAGVPQTVDLISIIPAQTLAAIDSFDVGGYTALLNETPDNITGYSISPRYDTDFLDFGDPLTKKIVRRIFIKAQGSGTLTVKSYLDFSATAYNTQNFVIPASTADQYLRVDLPVIPARHFKFSFSAPTGSQYFELFNLLADLDQTQTREVTVGPT